MTDVNEVVALELGPLFTLVEVKEHLRVDHDDDDDLIQSYMASAVSSVLMFCNTSLVPIGAEAVFKTAAMMAVSDLYENREGGEGLPRASQRLLWPYRNLRV